MADTTHLVLRVDGMDCDHCAGRIRRVLTRIAGVVEAEADHTHGQVRITFDGARVGRADLVTSIERAGFSVPDIEA